MLLQRSVIIDRPRPDGWTKRLSGSKPMPSSLTVSRNDCLLPRASVTKIWLASAWRSALQSASRAECLPKGQKTLLLDSLGEGVGSGDDAAVNRNSAALAEGVAVLLQCFTEVAVCHRQRAQLLADTPEFADVTGLCYQ